MASANVGIMLSRMNSPSKQNAATRLANSTNKKFGRAATPQKPAAAAATAADAQAKSTSAGFRTLQSVATWWRTAEKETAAEPKPNKSSAFDILKDPAKDLNQRLYEEYDMLQTEYKRLKSYIEHLEREYAESKELFDIFRRYQKLKVMIKRLVMYLKLSNNELIDTNQLHDNNKSAVVGLVQNSREIVKKSELSRQRQQKHAAMTSDELNRENEELQSSIKATRRRIALIKDLITQVEDQYEASKRFFLIQRYRLLKSMVKNVITNQLIRDIANA